MVNCCRNLLAYQLVARGCNFKLNSNVALTSCVWWAAGTIICGIVAFSWVLVLFR